MEKIIQLRKKEFWDEDRFNDISFRFPKNENKILKANRMILALCSPVFEAMFYGNLAEKCDTVPIVDIEYDEFMKFLRYIYTEEFRIITIDDIYRLYYAANKYEIRSLERELVSHIHEHLFSYDLFEVKEFAEMYFLDELRRLCELLSNVGPRTEKPANWVRWKRGDPLPSGMYFTHFYKEKWPIGICKFVGNHKDDRITPGTLYIKDMLARNGTLGVVNENRDEFEILCDGNLDWVKSSNAQYEPQSIIVDKCFYIGKTEIKGEIVFGKVEPRIWSKQYCLFVPYKDREVCAFGSYFQLIDKNSKESQEPNYMQKCVD